MLPWKSEFQSHRPQNRMQPFPHLIMFYMKGLGSRMTKICPIQYIDQNACKHVSMGHLQKQQQQV